MPAARAAKEETPVFLLAAYVRPELIENSHQGHRLPTAVLYPGIGPINSSTTSGLHVCLYDSGRRSRSTSKERDAETGLDFFGGRYLSAAQGRFTSVDPAFESAILELPQTWNRYSYVYNRPLFGTDPDGRCPICVGAIVGGVVEGGWDLGSQFIQHGYSLSGTDWGQVGANFVGGAVAGGLAVATGGTSLFASPVVGDLFAGTVSTTVGGIVTRIGEGDDANEILSPGNIATDAVSGFVGGGVAHLAADAVHIPDDPRLPASRRHAVGRRTLANYDAAVGVRNNAIRVQAGVGVAAGSPSTHGVNSFIDNFWYIMDRMVSPAPPPPPNNNSSRIVDCKDMQGNPCSN
jgi:RHS repeat-associated protein